MIKFLKKFWSIYWQDYEAEVNRGGNPLILKAWYWLWFIGFIALNKVALLLIYAGFKYHWFAFIGSAGLFSFIWYMIISYTKSGGQYR
jgi:hypothetical protein